MKILGISGKAGVGKDEACFTIIKHIQGAVRVAFADALKKEVATACGVSLDEINKNKKIFRPMLQWWGTEFRRVYKNNPNYWIDKVDESIETFERVFPNDTKLVIIPDVRFDNEYEYVLSKGGIMLLIKAGDRVESIGDHPSETSLDKQSSFDYVFYNNGTLEAFRRSIRDFATKILTQYLGTYKPIVT